MCSVKTPAHTAVGWWAGGSLSVDFEMLNKGRAGWRPYQRHLMVGSTENGSISSSSGTVNFKGVPLSIKTLFYGATSGGAENGKSNKYKS